MREAIPGASFVELPVGLYAPPPPPHGAFLDFDPILPNWPPEAQISEELDPLCWPRGLPEFPYIITDAS